MNWRDFLESINWHPVVEYFPEKSKEEFEALVLDLEKRGQQLPILIYKKKLADGRHRIKAFDVLQKKGVKVSPRIEEWKGDEVGLYDYVIGNNTRSKHLRKVQLAFIALRRKEGKNYHSKLKLTEIQRKRLAKEFGVSLGMLNGAIIIHNYDLKSKTNYEEKLFAGEEKYRDLQRVLFKLSQERKIRNVPELPSEKFHLIYGDPPWPYEFAQDENRRVENEYTTMSLDQIKAEKDKIDQIAGEDCILLLWSPAPKLNEALEVMKEWGFTYKTHAVWDKVKMGMGYYWRQVHEDLLLGTRGTPLIPPASDKWKSIFMEERSPIHSKKPDIAYRMIDEMFPGMKKIELFARGKKSDLLANVLEPNNWRFYGAEVKDDRPEVKAPVVTYSKKLDDLL